MKQAHTVSPGEPEAAFDEAFYLKRYPAVAEAVQHGEFASGLEHYRRFGAHEGRVTSQQLDDACTDLMRGFCSLGLNCEFGMAQRAFGAEPIDLFRWALTQPDVLIRLLRAKFAGIGDPNQIEVYANPTGEYYVRHSGYRFAWHAWANVGETTPERLRDRESKRLPFLARKLMEEMQLAARIFVVTQPDMASGTAAEILSAMHIHGRSTLLHVTQAAPRSVQRSGAYLLQASIPQFADQAAVLATLSAADWLSVCQQARAI
jgi:hypothetical protein